MRKGRGWTREITISFQFLAIEPRFVRKGCAGQLEITILPQFLTIVRKGCAGQLGNRNFTAVFGDRTSFRAKGLRGTSWNRNFTAVFGDRTSFGAKGLRRTTWKSQFYRSFLTIEPHFVRKGCAGQVEIAILPQFLAIELCFVRKGCTGRLGNRNFTAVFDDRTSFRAKGLRFVPSRWHCPCPRLQKRNRKEGEGKRARGEDVKMWGCEDVKMWGWEDVKMSRCEDVKMWRWADVKMRRCENVKMWRWWENVKMRGRPPLLEEPCAQTLSGKKLAIFFNQSDWKCTTPPFFGSGDFSKLQIADSDAKSGFDKNASKPDGPNESICWKFVWNRPELNFYAQVQPPSLRIRAGSASWLWRHLQAAPNMSSKTIVILKFRAWAGDSFKS